jgi:hypothetical protein
MAAEASTAKLLRQNLTEHGLVRILAREDIAPELFRELPVEDAARMVQRSLRSPSSRSKVVRLKSKKTVSKAKKSKKKSKAARKKTAPKARAKVQPNYWRRVKNELHVLICTNDKKYAGLRRQIQKQGSATQTVLVSNVASGIALSQGYTAAALVPFVAMALLAFIRIGANAWCAGQS